VVLLSLAVLAHLALPAPGETYRRWIDELAEECPVARENAAVHLRAAGRAAWPDLETASRSHPDPECRARAADLLRDSRRRRTISHLVLEEHPDALRTLENGATTEKIRLIRALGRAFDTSSEILLDLIRDADPEVAIAAAEALQENRNFDWTPRLLEIYAAEEVPRQTRVFELLASAYARIQPADLQGAFTRAGPRARTRFLQLSLHASLPLAVLPGEVRAMLRQGDPAARRAALSWMRDRGSAGNEPEIEPLLSAVEPGVVADALSTLRQLRRRPDPAAIAALLAHDEPAVRDEAAQAAAAFEERSSLPGLRALLRDSSTAVRQSALTAIWRIEGNDALGTLLDLFLRDAGDAREQAAGLLASAREWSLPRARALLGDPDADRRLRAHDLLSRLEGPAVLFPLAADPEEAVRRWALGQILRRIETPRALETVETFTRDPSEPVRFEAIRTLVRLGRREHADDLAAFLESREYTLRYDAAETILEHGGDCAGGVARALLRDNDGPLRRLALNSMADRGDRDGVDRALVDLEDPDTRLRRAAASYLGKVLAAKREPAVVARIASGLETFEGETLGLAFRLVVDHGDASSAPAIRKLIAAGRAPSTDRAVRAISEWSGDKTVAELASLLGDDPLLDEYLLVRVREARTRLPGTGTRELGEALRRLLGSRDRRVRRMATGAAEEYRLSIDVLPALVEDPAASVRCAAIAACARLGLPAAAGAIEGRFEDEDPDVRVAAVSAYAKLRPFDVPPVDRAVASEDCTWARKRMEFALKR
jgi:HEAT repeat protein